MRLGLVAGLLFLPALAPAMFLCPGKAVQSLAIPPLVEGVTAGEARLFRPVFSTNVRALNEVTLNIKYPATNIVAGDPAEWLRPDAEFEEQMALRWELYLAHPDKVFRVAPGYEERVQAASEELLEIVSRQVGIVPRRTGLHPLIEAGLLVQDDLTLTMPDPQGTPRLVAGFVPAPSEWSLPGHLGKDIHDIHSVVRNYDRIRRAVEGVVTRPAPCKLIVRTNWLVTQNPSYATPTWQRDIYVEEEVTGANALDRLYLRSELQSILWLPRSRAVLFTIRPRVWTLRFIRERAPGKAAELVGALSADEDYDEWTELLRR